MNQSKNKALNAMSAYGSAGGLISAILLLTVLRKAALSTDQVAALTGAKNDLVAADFESLARRNQTRPVNGGPGVKATSIADAVIAGCLPHLLGRSGKAVLASLTEIYELFPGLTMTSLHVVLAIEGGAKTDSELSTATGKKKQIIELEVEELLKDKLIDKENGGYRLSGDGQVLMKLVFEPKSSGTTGPIAKPASSSVGGRLDAHESERRFDLYATTFERMSCEPDVFARFIHCGKTNQNHNVRLKLRRAKGISQPEKLALLLANKLMDLGFDPARTVFDDHGMIVDMPAKKLE